MLEGMTPPSKERLCLVGVRASELDVDDLAVFMDAINDPRWIAEDLSAELTKRGVKISTNVIRKHRKKVCVCAR